MWPRLAAVVVGEDGAEGGVAPRDNCPSCHVDAGALPKTHSEKFTFD